MEQAMRHEALNGVRNRVAARPAPGGGAALTFAATLPMRSLPRFTPGELVAALNRILHQAGTMAELVPELTRFEQSPGAARVWHRPKSPPRIGVGVAGVTVVVEGQDRPAFAAREIEALDSRSWPDGIRRLGRAHAHVRVAEAGPGGGAELDHNHDRAAALTAVAAAVAELATPAGVVWESAGTVLPPERLAEAMEALARGAPPLALWLGAGARGSGAVETRGLYPLLGAEIEVAACGLVEDTACAMALALAAEILEEGRPPAEGARLDCGRRGTLRVRYRGAGADGAPPAVVLEQPRGPALPYQAGAA